MKKWLVALLVLAAVVLLLSPGIIGRLAEQQVRQNIQWADDETVEVAVTTESFDRGWFSSAGRHRVVLMSGQLQGLLDGDEDHAMPSLIIETRVDHGIVPFTSLRGDSGSLKPSLARAVATLQLDPGDGQLIAIPGKIVSEIGLSGQTTGRYQLEAGTFKSGDVTIEWTGADIEFVLDPAKAFVAATGKIQPFSVISDSESAEFGEITFSADQSRTQFGFNVGSLSLEMGKVTVREREGAVTGIGKVTFDTNVHLDAERIYGRSRMQLEALRFPDYGDVDLNLDLVANGLDAASLGKITRALEEAQATVAPGQAMAGVYPAIEADLQRFLSAGMELRFDQLDVSMPQGDISSRISFKLPESDVSAPFSWAGMLLALDASADITVPAALVEMASAMNPQAGSIVQMGLLKQNGDNYEMRAQFASGLLSINGVPMPVPMPGM